MYDVTQTASRRDGLKMAMRDEPTIHVTQRVPQSLMEAAQAKLPGVSRSSVMRVALARLAGIDSDQFVSNIRPGGKSGKRQTAA
jgi:hypothetical protein